MIKRLKFPIIIISMLVVVFLLFKVLLQPSGFTNELKLIEKASSDIYPVSDNKEYCETYFSTETNEYCKDYVELLQQYDSYQVKSIDNTNHGYKVTTTIDEVEIVFYYTTIESKLHGIKGILYKNTYKIDLIVME